MSAERERQRENGSAQAGEWVLRTRLSAAVLAMLALLLATLARVTPVALDPMDETDWLSSSASRSANTLSDGALCRFSFKMRCFHPSAVCELYMLYWRPLIAARAGAGTSASTTPHSNQT